MAYTKIDRDFPKLVRESGFSFDLQSSKSRVDWNNIRAIDINRLLEERDFRTVDRYISEVLNCHLESEFNVNILDSGFIKLFRLAQLSLEYLLECRHCLDLITSAMKSEMGEMNEKMIHLKKQLHFKEEEIKKLQGKLRKRQKAKEFNYNELSNIFKHLSFHSEELRSACTKESDKVPFYKCFHCEKVFLNHYYLQSHISRRHPNNSPGENNIQPNDNRPQYGTEKLHLEIKELKDRLNASEQIFHLIDHNIVKGHSSDLSKEDIEISEKCLLSQNDNGGNDNINPVKECNPVVKVNAMEMDQKTITMEIFEEWKNNEKTKHQNDIETLKLQIIESINLIREQFANQKKNEPDENMTKIAAAVNKQEDEIKFLKNDLGEKSLKSLAELKSHFENQERNWSLKLQAIENQNFQTINELKSSILKHINETQSMQQEYYKRVDLLENNTKEQMKLTEEQAKQIFEVTKDTHSIISQISSTDKIKNDSGDPIISNIQETPHATKDETKFTHSIPKYVETPSVSSIKTTKVHNVGDNEKINESDESRESSFDNDSDYKTSFNAKIKSPGDNRKENVNSPSEAIRDKFKNSEIAISKTHPTIPAYNNTDKKPKTVRVKEKNSHKKKKSNSKAALSDEKKSEKHSSVKNKFHSKAISIEKILADKPSLKKSIKEDLYFILNKKMEKFGIEPDSKNISTEELKNHLKTLQNKRFMFQKQYIGYNRIKDKLIKTIDAKIKEVEKVDKTAYIFNPTSNKAHSPLSKMGSIINTVKNKAMNISKSKETLKAFLEQRESLTSLKSYPQKAFTNSEKTTERLKDGSEKVSAKSILALIDDTKMGHSPSQNKHINLASKRISISSDDLDTESASDHADKDNDKNTRVPSLQELLISPVRRPHSANSMRDFGNGTQLKKDIDEQVYKSSTTIEVISDDETSLSDNHTLEETHRRSDIGFQKKSFSSDNLSGKNIVISPKGVLKSVSSTGSLTKKRVIFDLKANDSNLASIKNNAPPDDIRDIEEDTFSSNEEKLHEEFTPSNTIQFKTKQSPKIAEIASSIETQLISRKTIKPPPGGVETLFQVKNLSMQPRDITNPVDKDRLSIVNAEVPKSESKKTVKANDIGSDIELSDWSIDELLHIN